jgi:hypothetical protein
LSNIIEVVSRTQEIQSTLVAIITPKIGTNFTLDVKLGNDVNQRTSRNQQVQVLTLLFLVIYNLTNTSTQRFSLIA